MGTRQQTLLEAALATRTDSASCGELEVSSEFCTLLFVFEYLRLILSTQNDSLSNPSIDCRIILFCSVRLRLRCPRDMGLRGNIDSGYRPMDRIDSVEDMTQVLTEAERYDRVTACEEPSSCQDGVLEVVSIRSAFHLGQIRVGLSHAQRLCSCREATIHIKRKVAVQIDGEPCRQNVCTMKVKRKSERATMLHRPEDKNGVETEMAKLLDWAEERKLIDQNVHKTLTKEYSRRIEYKTRQRRKKAKDHNIMFSLKRAIGSTGAISSYSDENYEYSC